ncbi:MAG: hypothetical protein ACLFU1_08895 [Alphaproteobacteria bacterium]
MSKFTLNKTEYDLETSENCAQAIEAVGAHITKLKEKKSAIDNKLSKSLMDFTGAKKLRRNALDFGEEIQHFKGLLQELEKRRDKLIVLEEELAIENEIDRLDHHSIEISNLCTIEIPRCSRKIAVIAAMLVQHKKEVERFVDRAEKAGMDTPDCSPDPIQRIAGYNAHAGKWLKELSLPLIDEQPDILKFWPLPDTYRASDTYQDNTKIADDAAAVLQAESPMEAAEKLFKEIDRRPYKVRPVEEEEDIIEDHSKPFWYERPRQEWPELLKPNSVSACVRQLGDPVQLWLSLPEKRKYGAFIHLLSPEQREQAIEKLPKKERKKYLDHLMAYASNDSGDGEKGNITAVANA